MDTGRSRHLLHRRRVDLGSFWKTTRVPGQDQDFTLPTFFAAHTIILPHLVNLRSPYTPTRQHKLWCYESYSVTHDNPSAQLACNRQLDRLRKESYRVLQNPPRQKTRGWTLERSTRMRSTNLPNIGSNIIKRLARPLDALAKGTLCTTPIVICEFAICYNP